MPEIFRNGNGLPLGVRQDGTCLGDVVLPPWANGSAEEFVRLHRAALECEYVSQNLHNWIDLVFGHKQKGKEAKEANNLFYYLTYEGALDVSKIEDPNMRRAIKVQIANFGQTPSQLFKDPHPVRNVGVGGKVEKARKVQQVNATTVEDEASSEAKTKVDVKETLAALSDRELCEIMKKSIEIENEQAAVAHGPWLMVVADSAKGSRIVSLSEANRVARQAGRKAGRAGTASSSNVSGSRGSIRNKKGDAASTSSSSSAQFQASLPSPIASISFVDGGATMSEKAITDSTAFHSCSRFVRKLDRAFCSSLLGQKKGSASIQVALEGHDKDSDQDPEDDEGTKSGRSSPLWGAQLENLGKVWGSLPPSLEGEVYAAARAAEKVVARSSPGRETNVVWMDESGALRRARYMMVELRSELDVGGGGVADALLPASAAAAANSPLPPPPPPLVEAGAGAGAATGGGAEGESEGEGEGEGEGVANGEKEAESKPITKTEANIASALLASCSTLYTSRLSKTYDFGNAHASEFKARGARRRAGSVGAREPHLFLGRAGEWHRAQKFFSFDGIGQYSGVLEPPAVLPPRVRVSAGKQNELGYKMPPPLAPIVQGSVVISRTCYGSLSRSTVQVVGVGGGGGSGGGGSDLDGSAQGGGGGGGGGGGRAGESGIGGGRGQTGRGDSGGDSPSQTGYEYGMGRAPGCEPLVIQSVAGPHTMP